MNSVTPWISCIIPTSGRRTLGRLIRSITDPGVEVIVVADTRVDNSADFTVQLSAARSEFRNKVKWVDHAGESHNYGHWQRNKGIEVATAPWLIFSQDDNSYEPTAFTDIWFAICEQPRPRPIIFRVETWQAGIVWKVPVIADSNVDADCIVCPNNPAKLAKWGDRYQGDLDFITNTAALYEDDVAWNTSIIVRHTGRE